MQVSVGSSDFVQISSAKILNDLDFAEDIALLKSSISHAQAQLTSTVEAAKDLLIISASRTKYMTATCHQQPSLQVCGKPINHVADFKYLGSKIASAAGDFKRRNALAWSAFWKLERFWRSPQLTIFAKVNLFYTTCLTILLYGSESWVLSQDMESKINSFVTSGYRIMLDIKRTGRVFNTIIYTMTNTEQLVHCVRKCQLAFLGHILRLPQEEPARRYALCIPSHCKKRPRRLHTSYLAYIQRVLGYDENEMATEKIATLAKDRCAWRQLVITCSAAEG